MSGLPANPAESLLDALGAVPVVFGLRAQGHLPTIRRMLHEGATWADIGAAIGWTAEAAMESYEEELRREKPKFAVRVERGLVTHWQDSPLLTHEKALACRDAIYVHTGELGQIEEVILSA